MTIVSCFSFDSLLSTSIHSVAALHSTKPMRIVIIGAGWGGQGVCKALAAASLPADTSITCIDAADHLSIGATWQFELEGRAAPVSLPLADSCAAPYLKRAAASTIDYEAKTVALAGGEVLGYDRLVLACGAVSDPSSVPGLAEHAVDISAKGFAAPVEAFFEGLGAGRKTVHVAVAKAPYKCPPLPFEVAFLVDAMARRRGVRDRVDIVVTYPVPWPFGGPEAKRAFAAAMDEKGIAYRPNTKLVSVAADGARKTTTLASTAEGAEGPADGVTSDLLLAVYPHRAPDVIAPALRNAKGSVPVDSCPWRSTRRRGPGAAAPRPPRRRRRAPAIRPKIAEIRRDRGERRAVSRDRARGGRRGGVAVAGGGLGVVERVEHVLRAGEGVGVSPGCEIGVGEVVLVPDGLE